MADFSVKLSPSTSFKIEQGSSGTEYTLKNTTVNTTRLDNLADVVESDAAKINGAILIYNASNDTYVLSQAIFEEDAQGNYILKGGSF